MNYDYVIREHQDEHGKAEARCFQFSDGKGNPLGCRGRVKFADGYKECPQHVFKKGQFKPGAVTSVYLAGAESFEPLPKDDARALWERFYSAGLVILTEGESCAEKVDKTVSIPGCVVASFQTVDDGWDDEFKRLASRKKDRQIVIFADNDAPSKEYPASKGATVARKRAQQAHDAGFDDVRVVYMTQRRDGSPAPDDGYDIGDWLDEPDDVLIDELIAHATPYDAIAERVKECAAKQIKPREDDDINAIEDENFPASAYPESIRSPAEGLRDKFKLQRAPCYAVGESLIGCFIGKDKARLVRDTDNSPVYPNMSVIVVGESGDGKSPILDILTSPISDIETEETGECVEEEDRDVAKEELGKARRERVRLRVKHKVDAKLDKMIEELEKMSAAPIQYIFDLRSGRGLTYDLDENIENARKQRVIPNGAVVVVDDAGSIFNNASGAGKGSNELDLICKIEDYRLCHGGVVGHGLQKKKTRNKKFCAGFILSCQPTGMRSFIDPQTRGEGYQNRPTTVRVCYSREVVDDEYDINPALVSYCELFHKAKLFQGAVFKLDENAKKTYRSWINKNKNRQNQAFDFRDSARKAYIGKAWKYCLKRALVYHCVKCFERAEIIDVEGKKRLLFEGGEIKTTIDGETMKAAITVTDAFIDCRNAAWRLVEKVQSESKYETTTGLSPDAEKVKDALATGELVDRYDVDGATYEARRASITEINKHSSPYRKPKTRARIDKELIDAGEMFIDREERIAVIRLEEEWHD